MLKQNMVRCGEDFKKEEERNRTGSTKHHRSGLAAVQCLFLMAAHQRSDVSSCEPLGRGRND